MQFAANKPWLNTFLLALRAACVAGSLNRAYLCRILYDVARQFMDFMQKPKQNSIPYEISGKLESGLFGSVRFSDKDVLKLPQ